MSDIMLNRLFSKGNNKKAQGAGSAAALVTIMTLIIILYILFLPPSEREALLEGKQNETTGEGIVSNETLLLENPGTLDYMKESSISKSIPNIRLFSETVPISLKTLQTLSIRNAWFDNKPAVIKFEIPNLEETEDVIVSGNIVDSEGKLIVKLNNEEIYNKELDQGNLEPIMLPKELLKSKNELELMPSSVGVRFWKANKYVFEDFKITADFTDTATLNSRNVFLVSSTETNNIDQATLKFFIYCNIKEAKLIDININNHNIYSQSPDCNSRVIVPFSPHYLTSGDNIIEFKATEGRYTVDAITIDVELKEISNPVYYFELTEKQLDSVEKRDYDAVFKLRFVDELSKKEADLVFNGHLTRLNTRESEFKKVINNFVEEGTNGIKIIPKTRLEISELEVYLE